MKVPRKSRRQPDPLRLTCARVRPPIREQGTGKGTGSMEQGINSPPIPTPLNAHRSHSPMDGQPQACKCQCHTERDNPPGDPFCCPPIDSTPGPAPIDVSESLRRAGAVRWYLPPEPRSIAKIVGIVEMTEVDRERGLARLRFAVAWCGPWERLEAWLLGIDAGSLDLRRVIREHSLREAFAVWCGSRDLAWQRRHVDRGTSPARRWARKAAR